MKKICPECFSFDVADQCPDTPRHTWKCSQATKDDFVAWIKLEKKEVRNCHKRFHDQIARAVAWEGKYRIVKHENNQLRKKLFPKKTNET